MATDRLRYGSSGERESASCGADAERICSGKSTLTLTQKVLEMISGTFFVTTFIAPFRPSSITMPWVSFVAIASKKSFS